MELFGYYLPEEIINWFCDDWINEVYKATGHLFVLNDHLCGNMGGPPRYDVNNDPTFCDNFDENKSKSREKCMEIVMRDLNRIVNKI